MRSFTQTEIELKKRKLWIAALVAAAIAVSYLFRDALLDAGVIVSGAAAVAFLTEPVASLLEKWLSRPLAALFALLSLAATVILAAFFLLPLIARQLSELLRMLPLSVNRIMAWVKSASAWVENRIPGFHLPVPSFFADQIPFIASRTISFAGGVADLLYRFSLMIVLGYFFLIDRARLSIRIELLLPKRIRNMAVKTGASVCRELKNYLRGQGMIAAAVGVLSAFALWMIGIDSAIALGMLIGVLNMIPYFGPVIGAVPAVLTALGGGLKPAMYTVAVLWLVQQIDSTLISPRIMSSISGISPAAVLMAVFIGSALGGIVGMLLAMPAVMAFRTVFRVFVQRYENV